MRPPRWRARARALRTAAVLAALTALGLEMAPTGAGAQGLLPLPAAGRTPIVVLRQRVRPGVRAASADLVVLNPDPADAVWCELWADNAEPSGNGGGWQRLDRDEVIVGTGRANSMDDTIHLEATIVSTSRYNVHVRCAHTRGGHQPFVMAGASLEIHAATDVRPPGGRVVIAPATTAPRSGAATTAPPSAPRTTVAKAAVSRSTTTVAKAATTRSTTTVAKAATTRSTTTVAKAATTRSTTTVAKAAATRSTVSSSRPAASTSTTARRNTATTRPVDPTGR